MTGRPSGRGSVRILGGRWKGRKLIVSSSARPTSGRARQALFDLLGERVAGARFLDLYAGTGAVGLEAVSRGASTAVLIEAESASLVRSLEGWDVRTAEVRVVGGSVSSAIERLATQGERFDIVFADPPYALRDAALAGLSDLPRILSEGAVVVIQGDAGGDAPELPGLRELRGRAYGRNVLHFLAVL
jgi:16S rRNA (guanine966-N2)-methyltransferase